MIQRRHVLEQEPRRIVAFGRQTVAVNVNALEFLVLGGVALAGDADHADRVSGVTQGGRLHPDAPIKRHGQVLDHDQDFFALTAWVYTGIDQIDAHCLTTQHH